MCVFLLFASYVGVGIYRRKGCEGDSGSIDGFRQ